MGARPGDWSPLFGGDPCPGDPGAWDAVVDFWAQRCADINGCREKLNQHTSIDAEGKTFGRLEAAFSDGADMVARISSEFEKASSITRSWQRKLADMQLRADEALGKARAAQAVMADTQVKIAALEAEAAKDKLPDPVIAVKIHGLFGGGGLMGEIADAQAEIQAAQRVVDGIRDEYARESAVVISGYELASVESIYAQALNRSPGGNPFSSPHEVREHLWDFDPELLSRAFENARQNPESFPKLLNLLSEMTPQEIQEYFVAHPEMALVPLFPEGTSVENTFMVKDWWGNPPGDGKSGVAGEKLSDEQKRALIEVAPGFVGNLDGVSYTERDQALRGLLDDLLVGNKWVVAGESMDVDTKIALENVKFSLDSEEYRKRQLIHLDLIRTLPKYRDNNPDNNVMASISIGDLDASQNTTAVIHGMDNSVYESMTDQMQQGQNIYNRREAHLGGTPQAVIVRAGYDAPPTVGEQAKGLPFEPEYEPYKGGELNAPYSSSVRRPDLAERGGVSLASFSDGLLATKASNIQHLNDSYYSIIAHSYGTTVATDSLTRMQGKVDDYVAVGSAGVKQPDINQANSVGLAVERGEDGKQNIYYAATDKDWTAPGGYVGTGSINDDLKRDTPDKILDATALQTGGGYSLDGKYWEDVDHHGLTENSDPGFFDGLSDFPGKPGPQQGYYTLGTTSLEMIAQASVGKGENAQRFVEPVDQWKWGWFSGERSISGDVSEEKVRELMREQELVEGNVVDSKPDDVGSR